MNKLKRFFKNYWFIITPFLFGIFLDLINRNLFDIFFGVLIFVGFLIICKKAEWQPKIVFYIVITLLPMIGAAYFAISMRSLLSIDTWRLLLLSRIILAIISLVVLFVMAIYVAPKNPFISKSVFLTRIVAVLVFILPFILLDPFNSYKDLVNKTPKTYFGNCSVSSWPGKRLYYYIYLDSDSTVRFEISPNLYYKVGSTNYFMGKVLVGYDGPCRTYVSVYYLPNSKYAFE